MSKASVPFAEIKKELLSNPEVKEEYDKLEAEYKSLNQMNQQDIDKASGIKNGLITFEIQHFIVRKCQG